MPHEITAVNIWIYDVTRLPLKRIFSNGGVTKKIIVAALTAFFIFLWSAPGAGQEDAGLSQIQGDYAKSLKSAADAKALSIYALIAVSQTFSHIVSGLEGRQEETAARFQAHPYNDETDALEHNYKVFYQAVFKAASALANARRQSRTLAEVVKIDRNLNARLGAIFRPHRSAAYSQGALGLLVAVLNAAGNQVWSGAAQKIMEDALDEAGRIGKPDHPTPETIMSLRMNYIRGCLKAAWLLGMTADANSLPVFNDIKNRWRRALASSESLDEKEAVTLSALAETSFQTAKALQ